ncbi:MAG TPA: recombinase family protein [Clostridiales bacterium]|nr:recombinase family protein [Clostridiales bacterium]
MSIYGYIRISTNKQKTDRQWEALKSYEKENKIQFDAIFEDKQSGKDFNRSQYKALKNSIKKGDVLVVKELDRFGRNYEEIKQELAYFQSMGIKVIILDLPVLNVEDETLSSLLNNLIIELLSYIAQKEREKIQDRVKEGLQVARNKGVKLGRPERKLPDNFEKYYKRWKADEITAVEFAKLIGVSRATIYNYINEYECKSKE